MRKPVPARPKETIGDLIDYIAPGVTEQALLEWPPDAFAVAAFVLQKTGAYLKVVQCDEWPPKINRSLTKLTREALTAKAAVPVTWVDAINVAGNAWRIRVEKRSASPLWNEIFDMSIKTWISAVVQARKIRCVDLPKRKPLVDMWLQILAAADDTFATVGFTPGTKSRDLNTIAYGILRRQEGNSTLCSQLIRPEVAGVLPKLHTPQTGITLRSLSHYLAFYRMAEVKPKWDMMMYSEVGHRQNLNIDAATQQSSIKPDFKEEVLRQPSINLLLAPWPSSILPRQFMPAPWTLNECNAHRYGFFEFEHDAKHSSCSALKQRLENLHEQATKVVGRIDGVVLPELAINGFSCAKNVANSFLAKNSAGFFVAGVGEAGKSGKPGRNSAVWMQNPLGANLSIAQAKHHRWQLNRSQIENFGLGGRLNPSLLWWEHIELASRELRFIAFSPWFTATVLVCEDLARQEPISELIRAVGPTLVIALLMDGPQLSDRWPGRYATSLADDPGSSVLTFTSLGMAELSRPRGKEVDRTVALWKDQQTGVTPIKLPVGSDGIVLSLSHHVVEEWSADGRGDRGSSSYLSLSGVHPVFVKAPKSR